MPKRYQTGKRSPTDIGLTIRMPQALKTYFSDAAQENKRSLNSEILDRLSTAPINYEGQAWANANSSGLALQRVQKKPCSFCGRKG